MPQRLFNFRVPEFKSCRCELIGNGSDADEELLVGNFAEDGAQEKRGDPKESRPFQQSVECLGELAVGNGIRRAQIHRPGEGIGAENEIDGGDEVVDGDPAQVLLPRSENHAQTGFRQGQQPGQQSSLPAENGADA